MIRILFAALVLSATTACCGEMIYRAPSQIIARWDIKSLPGNSGSCTVKYMQQKQGVKKAITVLFSKQSSAYDTSMTALLNSFDDSSFAGEFTVHKLPKDKAKALMLFKGDLIFSMGSKAANFVHNNYNKAGNIPVVTVCAKDPVLLGQMPDYKSGSNSNITYTSLNMQAKLQFQYIRKLKPKLKAIGILYNTANTSAIQTQVEPLVIAAKAEGVTVVRIAVKNIADKKAFTRELESSIIKSMKKIKSIDADLSQSVLWMTGCSSLFPHTELINSKSEKIPLLSAIPDLMQEGAASPALSIGVSFTSNARYGANYALKILENIDCVGTLPVGVVNPPDIGINFMQTRRCSLKVPFAFFESATLLFDAKGKLVRKSY